ncbi:MAG TPA: hypothetical protein EYO51_01715 [Methylococcaceae bacterium]|nr:hypothetical protein [Methylococcaceae bacterium]HIN69192.1 hypothetical protein [Methylococcales bacterium]HIA46295.1 hypothetical protein [Methylococcaceae bacterium]HIB61874.1 hypothetical protein [Methylococcaceae bacterium]HIO13428.1 hypothetical protein [Methylococcales bacterium]
MAKNRVKVHRAPDQNKKIVRSVYEIGNDAVMDARFFKLPEAVQQQANALYDRMEKEGKLVIPELEALKNKYPKVPTLYNYLSAAYSRGDIVQQERCIEENYRVNGNNLIARCHYGQLCIKRKDFDQIPKIFDNKFDLKSLYPRRNRFHPSEYNSFSLVMCYYFNFLGEHSLANGFYQGLKNYSPDGVETQQAKRLLEPGFLGRMGKKLVNALG